MNPVNEQAQPTFNINVGQGNPVVGNKIVDNCKCHFALFSPPHSPSPMALIQRTLLWPSAPFKNATINTINILPPTQPTSVDDSVEDPLHGIHLGITASLAAPTFSSR